MGIAERLSGLAAAERRRLDPVLGALLEQLVRTPADELAPLAPNLAGEDAELRAVEPAICCAPWTSGGAWRPKA